MIAATTSTTGRRHKAAGWMSDVLARVLLCTLVPVLLMASTETRLINFRGLPGQRLTGQETFVTARSKIECAVTCKKRSQCSSFLFDAATRTCHLQAVSAPGSGYDVQHVYVVHECDDGRYGTFCLNPCSPYCNGICNKLTGECECKPGYMPTMCTQGECSCNIGYQPPLCIQECGNGRWGQNCSNNCSPQCTNICNVVTGECSCNPGYQPPLCTQVCSIGRWGQNCSETCSPQCTNICNVVTGECACNPGYQPPLCVQECSLGLFGQNCGLSCISPCSECDKVTGKCVCNRAYVPTYTASNFRLACGSTSREGRLEININGVWGTVCDDLFSTNASIVACRMMGYATTNPLVKAASYFGEGVGTIHLDDVICSGNELSLLDCQHSPIDTHGLWPLRGRGRGLLTLIKQLQN